MKTVFVITDDKNKEFLEKLVNKMGSSKELTLDGFEPLTDTSKQNLTFAQSDLLITDSVKREFLDECLSLVPYTNIILATSDTNRAQAVVSEYQKKNVYKVSLVDTNIVDASALIDRLENFNEETVVQEQKQLDMDVPDAEGFDKYTEETGTVESIKVDAEAESLENNRQVGDLTDSISENVEGAVVVEKVKLPDDSAESEVKESTEKPEENTENQNINFENSPKEERNPSILDNLRQEQTYIIQNNIFDISCKTVTVVSKKGGTGKSTVAKEIANIFCKKNKPKSNKRYAVTLVDLDFESGSLRAMLGFDNAYPNIYNWISDILDKIENNTKLEDIYFSNFEIANYLKKVPHSDFYALITNQGNIPLQLLDRIMTLSEGNDNLFENIIKKIIKSLKQVSDVLIIDTDSNFNELSKVAMERSNNILYVMKPTVADIDNFKVFSDEIASVKTIDASRVSVILNDIQDKNFLSASYDLLSTITYEVFDTNSNKKIRRPYEIVTKIPHNVEFVMSTNEYMFVKSKELISVCNVILPIFKTSQIRRENIDKKKNKNELKASVKGKGNVKALSGKPSATVGGKKFPKTQKEKIEELKAIKLKKAQETEAKRKGGSGFLGLFKKKQIDKTKNPSTTDENNQKPEAETNITNDDVKKALSETNVDDKKQALEYLYSDLTNVTLDEFVEKLKEFKIVKKTKFDFPVIKKQPKTLSKKVWNEYSKKLKVEIKRKK